MMNFRSIILFRAFNFVLMRFDCILGCAQTPVYIMKCNSNLLVRVTQKWQPIYQAYISVSQKITYGQVLSPSQHLKVILMRVCVYAMFMCLFK